MMNLLLLNTNFELENFAFTHLERILWQGMSRKVSQLGLKTIHVGKQATNYQTCHFNTTMGARQCNETQLYHWWNPLTINDDEKTIGS